MICPYRLVLEVHEMDGALLHSQTLEPDWEPAVEATRLAGLRTRGVWHQADGPDPVIEPVWHEVAGPPLVRSLRVSMEYAGSAWSAEFPVALYFGDTARAAVAALLGDGRVQPDDRVRYAVVAFAAAPAPADCWLWRDAKDVPTAVAVRDRDFGSRTAGALPCGEVDPSDFDLILPADVLEQVTELTRAAGERETGGVLLGHLCWDQTNRGIGVEVTAQVPAQHTVGDAVKLTFTSDTWTDVRNALALRKAGELMVGWWHSHPAVAWCKACPIERQRRCHLGTGFLSSDDRALHRAMFPAAYTQALVLTHSAAGVEAKLFGWRDGVLQPRGFGLLGDSASTLVRDVLMQAGGDTAPACADKTSLEETHDASAT